MQRDREYEQRRAPEGGGKALRLCRAVMQMGKQAVQRQHEQNTENEPARGGDPADAARSLGFLDCGDEQAPYGRRDHYPSREAQKEALYGFAGPAAQQEYHRRTERGHEKGEAGTCRCPKQSLCHGNSPRFALYNDKMIVWIIGNTPLLIFIIISYFILY